MTRKLCPFRSVVFFGSIIQRAVALAHANLERSQRLRLQQGRSFSAVHIHVKGHGSCETRMRSERTALDVAAVSRDHATSRMKRGQCCACFVRSGTRPYTYPRSIAARSMLFA